MPKVRPWFWVESALGLLTGALFIVTLAWKDWIELAFKVDPDQSSGSFEWMLVSVSAAVTVGLVFLARYEWRRARLARSS